MTTEMQYLVDGLARRLARTVAIDDREVRLVAYSSHEGVVVDPLRQYSILNRRVPPEVARYIHEQAGDCSGPFRIPPDRALGLELARVCIPISLPVGAASRTRPGRASEARVAALPRSRVGEGVVVYGWLTLLEDEGPLDGPDLDAAIDAARLAAIAFRRQRDAEERTSERMRDLVPRLVGGEDLEQKQAAQDLVESDLFVPGEPVAAAVVTLGPLQVPVDDRDRTTLKVVLEQVAHGLPARRCLHHARSDHGLLVLAVRELGIVGSDLQAVARALVDGLDRELGEPVSYVGLGDAVDELGSVSRSYVQARHAAEVARVVGGLGRVAGYGDLGVYALLARIPAAELRRDAVPANVLRLLELDEPGRVLVETIETFLDRAGNVKATAEALNVHRATLYYRLGRVESVAGVDLARGDDRLTLHMGLKLARMTGLLT